LTALSCSEDRSGSTRPTDRSTTEPSGQPTPDRTVSERVAAEQAVLAAYRGMQESITKALTHPGGGHPYLEKYAKDKALSDIYETLYFYQKNGLALQGEPTIAPRVTEVNLDRDPRTASISDCYDSRRSQPVDVRTGRSVSAPGQNQRYEVTAIARELAGRWYVVQITPDRSNKC
jgi:hypothetical protein